MTSKYDLGFAAGIFEGEGCITQTRPQPRKVRSSSSTRRGRYPRPDPKGTLAVSIAMTDLDTLERFVEIVGSGAIMEHTPDERFKVQWRWTAYSDNARRIIKLLWPGLGSRRRARATELWNATVNRNGLPLP